MDAVEGSGGPPTVEERRALMILNALPGMGPALLRRMLDACGGDPCAVLRAPVELLAGLERVKHPVAEAVVGWRVHFDPAREERWLAGLGADFVSVRDPAYPPLLREIHDPPIGLYRKGGYAMRDTCVAVVGSRRTTPYGLSVARELAGGLARAGVCVVSGMARGIDTAAHEAALEAGGRTVAVLGNGLDIVYPRENGRLYSRIAEAGAVLSEFPLGRPADRQTFAMRNRIVSGMCRAIVVVESDVDGGSMITARFAGEHGRIICAVPGRVDQPGSRGCHQLIRDGASLVTNVEEVLGELQYLRGVDAGSLVRSGEARVSLSEDERRMLECFAGGEVLGPDALARQLGGEAGTHLATLLMLEIKGCVARRTDGLYEVQAL